jgi:transposase
MDQVHVIRHKVLVEGLSARRVAREMGVSRNTVQRYLLQAAPTRVERVPRGRPVWEKARARLEALLAESPQWTGGKQRLTAARLHRMLLEEGFTIGVTMVKEAVAEWKRRRREVFVPLVYPAGDLAEVDFFEVLVELAGAMVKVWMFVMRLMHSGRDFAWLYTRQDQTSFLDAHVRAFTHFGCVPQRIAYDNLKAAVARTLVGSERVLAARFEALSSHYLFEACFCRPRTGHDKGGVESRGKAIRLQHLVPIPRGDDLGVMRSALLARLDAEHDATRFAAERGQSLPLPDAPFDSAPSFASKVVCTRCPASGQVSMSSRTSAPTTSTSWGPTALCIMHANDSASDPSTTATTSESWPGSRRLCARSPRSSRGTWGRASSTRGGRSSMRTDPNRERASSRRSSRTSKRAASIRSPRRSHRRSKETNPCSWRSRRCRCPQRAGSARS